MGTLVLAALAGIPNLYIAIRLAQRHRGPAVMTEAMNSRKGLGVIAAYLTFVASRIYLAWRRRSNDVSLPAFLSRRRCCRPAGATDVRPGQAVARRATHASA